MIQRFHTLLIILFAARMARAQTPTSTAFDGFALRTWVAKTVDDSSLFRRNRAAAAIWRAPPAFRRAFVRELAPLLEAGNADRRRRAIDAVMTVVNEGQFGPILEERGKDLSPAVPALQRIAANPSDDNRRRAWFLLERTDSTTRRSVLPMARAAIGDRDPGVRWQAVRFLATARDSTDVARLLSAARDSAASVRRSFDLSEIALRRTRTERMRRGRSR